MSNPRKDLINLIFGSDCLPETILPATYNVHDGSRIGLPHGVLVREYLVGSSFVYECVPDYPSLGDDYLLLHQGHTGQDPAELGTRGIAEVASMALAAGYYVYILGMPGRAGNLGSPDHESYTSLRPFIEPALAVLNYAGEMPAVGISGGAWAITVLAAIDERVRLSVPVAGTLPKRWRRPTQPGDWEQRHIYQIVDYPALYVLGCTDGRSQIQVLNKEDPCCFSEIDYVDAGEYTASIAEPANAIAQTCGGGSFTFIEDDTHQEHQISQYVINFIIRPHISLLNSFGSMSLYDAEVVGDVGVANVAGQNGKWVRWDSSGVTGSHLAMIPDASRRGSVVYKFSSLENGVYDINVKWPAKPDRSTAVPVTVVDDDYGSIATFFLDQSRATQQIAEETVGQFELINGNSITVIIGAHVLDGKTVVADTVEVVRA